MHYHSPKAYKYLCSSFALPNDRTIRWWVEAVDCQPGFLNYVIKTRPASNKFNAYSHIIDSMSIRKRLILNKSTQIVEGHVTVGVTVSEASVFLLVTLVGGV